MHTRIYNVDIDSFKIKLEKWPLPVDNSGSSFFVMVQSQTLNEKDPLITRVTRVTNERFSVDIISLHGLNKYK